MADYDGRAFWPTGSLPPPDGRPPIGRYHQDGDVVWAEFSGGQVRAGRLVGTVRADGTIDAAYCLVPTEGPPAAAMCVSTPTVLADGRIRLTEHWHRLDGSSGVSHLEEIVEEVLV
jgi:hypothetical protein